jgi:diguanylate cyclase (GGDEF)-like protein/PAS domain S-box-containing protein
MFGQLFTDQFAPHGQCFLWRPGLLWTFVISDLIIFLAYFTIPLALVHLVRKRIDLQFNNIFILFSLFIFACGATHLIDIINIWQPVYWLNAGMKVATAIFSAITAITVWRLMPLALTMTSSKQLEETIDRLKDEIAQKVITRQALEKLTAELESIVDERTKALQKTNEELNHEIIQKNLVQAELSKQRQQAVVTLESIGDAVISTDVNGIVTYINPIAESMTGWFKSEALGQPILTVFDIVHERTRVRAPNPIEIALTRNMVSGLAEQTLLLSKDGHEYAIEDSASPIKDENGNVLGAVLVFHDVSYARRMAQKMTYLAEHDHLTDLPNRMLLTDRINQVISSSRRRKLKFGVLFFDIDHFKKVNDSLGHEIGDELLKAMSVRIKSILRNSDTICRMGGDEFIVLLPEIKNEVAIAEIAQKISDAGKLLFKIDGNDIYVSLSIGITMFPEDGNNAEQLIRNADTAMYHVKNQGRGNYHFFTKEMSDQVSTQIELENSLLRAVEQEEFTLHYQPKVSITTGEIIGAEALLRWQHPKWGLVSPDRFIHIAELTGIIKSIGRWVLKEACLQNKIWQDQGIMIPIAVNASVIELRQPEFRHSVENVLLMTGLSPEYLELEITESVAILGYSESIKALEELKAMGVRLTVDDFGTGYSSLSYLKRLPVSTIKIDKSFIKDIQIDPSNEAIVTAIIKMSQSLKLKVIAEGVETLEQLSFLKQHHCDEIQGYYYSKPIPAVEFTELFVGKLNLLNIN